MYQENVSRAILVNFVHGTKCIYKIAMFTTPYSIPKRLYMVMRTTCFLFESNSP